MAPPSALSHELFLLQASSVSVDLVWMWAETGLIFRHCYTLHSGQQLLKLFCNNSEVSLSRWLWSQVSSSDLCSPRGRSSIRPKCNQSGRENRGSDGKTCTIHKDRVGEELESERTRDQGKRSGKLLPEPFKYRNFLQVLACSSPHGSPQMQKPGRSAAADTRSRCQSTRVRRRGRESSIKSTGSTSCRAAARGAH